MGAGVRECVSPERIGPTLSLPVCVHLRGGVRDGVHQILKGVCEPPPPLRNASLRQIRKTAPKAESCTSGISLEWPEAHVCARATGKKTVRPEEKENRPNCTTVGCHESRENKAKKKKNE